MEITSAYKNVCSDWRKSLIPDYNWEVGETKEQIIREAINKIIEDRNIPWIVEEHNVRANGPDIVIRDIITEEIIAKFEITNQQPDSYYSEKRARSTKKNLEDAPYIGIFDNFESNKKDKTKEILKDIPTLNLGFQILPENIYEKLPTNEKTHKKKYSPKILKLIKNALISFFKKIGLIRLVLHSTHKLVTNSVSSGSSYNNNETSQPPDRRTCNNSSPKSSSCEKIDDPLRFARILSVDWWSL